MKLTYTPESSHIKEFSHENGVLSVAFKNSPKVARFQVPEHEFRGMVKAPSAGAFLHARKKFWKAAE